MRTGDDAPRSCAWTVQAHGQSGSWVASPTTAAGWDPLTESRKENQP